MIKKENKKIRKMFIVAGLVSLKYTMDSPILIVSICMGKSIKIQRVNSQICLSYVKQGRIKDFLKRRLIGGSLC